MEELLSVSFFEGQFKKKNLCLELNQPKLIGTAQCGKYQRAYIVWRSAVLVILIFHAIYDLLYGDASVPAFVRARDWAHVCHVVESAALFSAAIDVQLFQGRLTRKPLFYKTTWTIYILTIDFSYLSPVNLLAFSYVSTIFGQEFSSLYESPTASYYPALFFVMVDSMTYGVPLRLCHVYITCLTTIVYITFSLVYWASTGRPVYDLLDWGSHPGIALIYAAVTIFIIAPLNFMSIFFLYWMRLLLHKYTLCKTENSCDASTEYMSDVHQIEIIDIHSHVTL